MKEERKLTLRNHAELMAGELDDVMLKVANIIDDIDANPDETIDDDIYTMLQDLLDKSKEANDVAWGAGEPVPGARDGQEEI